MKSTIKFKIHFSDKCYEWIWTILQEFEKHLFKDHNTIASVRNLGNIFYILGYGLNNITSNCIEYLFHWAGVAYVEQ